MSGHGTSTAIARDGGNPFLKTVAAISNAAMVWLVRGPSAPP